jgi:hypothetical protein
MRRWCFYCGGVPTRGLGDHILPKAWGGSRRSENMRTCCLRCNALRALCGHCPGAMLCVWAVAGRPECVPALVHVGLVKLWGWMGAYQQGRAARGIGGDRAWREAALAWPPMLMPAENIRPARSA